MDGLLKQLREGETFVLRGGIVVGCVSARHGTSTLRIVDPEWPEERSEPEPQGPPTLTHPPVVGDSTH